METQTSHENIRPEGQKSFLIRAGMLFTSLLLLGAMVIGAVRYVSAAAAPYVSIPNTVAPQVASAKVSGATATNQKMQLSVSLRSKNETGLRDYAGQVSQPKSKLFHQYLTPSQFATVFGADHNALSATEQYLQQQGLHLDNAASGGLFLTFSGTVAQVESAFKVHIKNYTGTDGRAFYANADSVQVPAALSGKVFNVSGLENARQWHPDTALSTKAVTKTAAATKSPKASISVTCPAGPTVTATGATKTANGLLPANLQAAYNFPGYASSPGNNVWAAMVELDGYQVYDLQQYEICAGINGTIQAATGNSPSSSNPFIINQNLVSSSSSTPAAGQNYGTPLSPGNYAASVTGELEALIGLAPYLSHISVIQNNNTTQGLDVALATIANQDAAQVVDVPWGMCEADVGFANASTEEYLFMQMALQGQSAFASTGDYGLYACDGDGNNFRAYSFTVQDPASDPFVTAVGGTELGVTGALGAPGTGTVTGWAAEQPWNNYPQSGTNVPTLAQGFLGGAGSGGISQFWAAPSWQVNAKAAFTTDPSTRTTAQVGVLSNYVLNNAINPTAIPARVIPDVSAAADPQNSSYAIYCAVGATPCQNNATTFTTIGGTGMASAVWTAAAALAVQAANTPAPTTGIGTRIGLMAPALYTTYLNDMAATTTTVGATSYCDYALTLGTAIGVVAAVGTAATSFVATCQGTAAGDFVLNNSVPLAAPTVSVSSSFPALTSSPFQQLAAAANVVYSTGDFSGFKVKGGFAAPSIFNTGFNALTGLGSPNVGAISGGAQLAAYLAAQARVAIPRIYMVAQSSSTSTYWLGSFAFNPYVQNMAVYTQWFQLSTQQVFSGAPTIVDDGKFAGAGAGNQAQNLFIVGPSNGAANAFSAIQWNINTQTSTVVSLGGASLPSASANNTSCSGVTAFTNATTAALASKIGIYCLTPAGNVYVTNLNTFTNTGTTSVSMTQAAWFGSPVLSNVSSLPQIATDGANHYEILLQTTGTSYNVVYTHTPISFANTGANVPGAATFGSLLTLATTCNSTPAIAYVVPTTQYQIACIAKDTHAMWANFYSATATVQGFSGSWTLLGQPSSGVTFLPGDAVAVDNVASDPGYGLVFYIAEGSDNGMYLNVVNTANSNFLFKNSNWQGVSLPGIFSSGAAASFDNA